MATESQSANVSFILINFVNALTPWYVTVLVHGDICTQTKRWKTLWDTKTRGYSAPQYHYPTINPLSSYSSPLPPSLQLLPPVQAAIPHCIHSFQHGDSKLLLVVQCTVIAGRHRVYDRYLHGVCRSTMMLKIMSSEPTYARGTVPPVACMLLIQATPTCCVLGRKSLANTIQYGINCTAHNPVYCIILHYTSYIKLLEFA